MTDLQKQLERLSRLEPSLCSVRGGILAILSISPAEDIEVPISNRVFDLALVQAAVQAAIVAREGWDYDLEYKRGCNQTIAWVWRNKAREDRCGVIAGHSPALAILTAYCDALEAERS